MNKRNQKTIKKKYRKKKKLHGGEVKKTEPPKVAASESANHSAKDKSDRVKSSILEKINKKKK